MKLYYTLGIALFACLSFKGFSQCSDVQPDVNYAYSHVKSAFEANNLTHLQYFADRSLKAYERAQEKFKTCDCEGATNFTYENIQYLKKVDRSETFEDARYYIKQSVEGAKNILAALDECTAKTYIAPPAIEDEADLASNTTEPTVMPTQTVSTTNYSAAATTSSADPIQLAEQKERELLAIKNMLISKNKSVLNTNVSAYNEALALCNCNTEPITVTPSPEDQVLQYKSIDGIRSHYLNALKTLTSTYLSKLNACATVE
ncbi:hypothetical protein [Formosa haliotis]|uniref:hypothetical protein n=1 Tax=Formosa haliotis TaxID=1555194 RepID=UPI0008241555|nr:hypothetical protein [Formosa haliotis]